MCLATLVAPVRLEIILLSALLVNIVPSVWAQDSKGVGVVTALTGRAQLKRPQAPQSVALKLRDNLSVRDIVETREESLTRILLLGKSTVTVRELSRFEIREEILADGAQRAVIDLAEGKMRVMVARRLMKPGDEVLIRTPNAVAGVRGSDGIIEVTTLPDGRPQTVVIGVSGEFELTLPRARPVTAMADAVSDARSGALLAQLPGVTTIQTGQRWDIVGDPPLQQAFQSFVSDLAPLLRHYRGKSVASGTGAQTEPEPVMEAVANAAFEQARAQALRDGFRPWDSFLTIAINFSSKLPPPSHILPGGNEELAKRATESTTQVTTNQGNGSNLIKNGNFVQGLEHWIASGAVSVIPLPGGGKSAFLTTGCVGSVCAIGNVRSELKQSFAVGSTLQVKFNYNFLSNEFPAFVGSIFNDAFEAKLIGPNGGSTLLATESVNSSTFKSGNGTGFNGQTGPKSIDTTMKVSSGQYTLSFSVADKGDTIVDTAVHVNNVSVTKK